jgi:hypothetical protein
LQIMAPVIMMCKAMEPINKVKILSEYLQFRALLASKVYHVVGKANTCVGRMPLQLEVESRRLRWRMTLVSILWCNRAKDRILIGNWIYWTLITHNSK